jgi:hypothetical protein
MSTIELLRQGLHKSIDKCSDQKLLEAVAKLLVHDYYSLPHQVQAALLESSQQPERGQVISWVDYKKERDAATRPRAGWEVVMALAAKNGEIELTQEEKDWLDVPNEFDDKEWTW